MIDKLTAYHKWLYKFCDGNQTEIARQLIRDCLQQNPQTFETLEATGLSGDKPLEEEDFKMAAKFVIELVEKEVSNV